MPALFDTILFDLDGTLLDTLADLNAAVNHALALFDFPRTSQEDTRRFVGNGADRLMERSLPAGIDRDSPMFYDCMRAFKAHYTRNRLVKTQPYPGILELLDDLVAQGVRLAVISNKPDDATVALTRHFFGDRISAALGASPDRPKKPAPDMVAEVLARLGAAETNAVFVGDSETDVLTARNAGLPFVGVLWGFRTREELLAAGAEIFIERPDELPAALYALTGGR